MAGNRGFIKNNEYVRKRNEFSIQKNKKGCRYFVCDEKGILLEIVLEKEKMLRK